MSDTLEQIQRARPRRFPPYPEYQDSGVEWLGETPALWKVKKLEYRVPNMTAGIVVTPSKHYAPEGVPCLRSLNISRGRVTMEDLVFISEEANELHRESKIFEGDVVVVRTSQAGTAAVVPTHLDGAHCPDPLIARGPTRIRPKIVYYHMNSRAAISQATERSLGSIQSHYNTSTLAQLFVSGIPIGEEDRILNHLDDATRSIGRLAAKVTEGIGHLKEFRTAPISATVSGRIDVREEVA